MAVHILELLIDEAAMPRGMQVWARGLNSERVGRLARVSPAVILAEAGGLPQVPGRMGYGVKVPPVCTAAERGRLEKETESRRGQKEGWVVLVFRVGLSISH